MLSQLLDIQAGNFLDFIMLLRQMLQQCLPIGYDHLLPNPFQLNSHNYLTTLFNVIQPPQMKVLFHNPLSIYGLFNDAVSSSVCAVPKGRLHNE